MEGERRQVTVLFADMVGFTTFSERSGEEAAYTLMRSLFWKEFATDAILQAAWRCWRRCAGSSAACRAASAPPTPIGQFASTPVPVPERPSVVHSSLYPPEPVYEVRRKIDPSVVQRLLSGLSAIMTVG